MEAADASGGEAVPSTAPAGDRSSESEGNSTDGSTEGSRPCGEERDGETNSNSSITTTIAGKSQKANEVSAEAADSGIGDPPECALSNAARCYSGAFWATYDEDFEMEQPQFSTRFHASQKQGPRDNFYQGNGLKINGVSTGAIPAKLSPRSTGPEQRRAARRLICSVKDVDLWLERYSKGDAVLLAEDDVLSICNQVRDRLLSENNVPVVRSPVTICGDIHGQYYDLITAINAGGELPAQNYVFLGDYVDRGNNSVEVFMYLLLLKARWPEHVTLLRGNHESRHVTRTYGFYDECLRKYGNATVWRACVDLFDYLAVGAIIDGNIFCVHGGLSPSIREVDQLRLLNRFQEISHSGPFADIVWSDPEKDVRNWVPNPRGAGWLFGKAPVVKFNHYNGLELIARAHQLVMEGYLYNFKRRLVTIWSAPNYCYRCGNVAAVLKLDENHEQNFAVYKEAPESKRISTEAAMIPYFL